MCTQKSSSSFLAEATHRWWQRARELRTIAADMGEPEAKAKMLRVAEECERLACQADGRIKKS
jgi:hypothetical protein